MGPQSNSKHRLPNILKSKNNLSRKEVGGDAKSTPFRLSKRQKETTTRPRKKYKSDKQAHIDPMLLIEGDLDEIRDKVRDTTIALWTQFEQ